MFDMMMWIILGVIILLGIIAGFIAYQKKKAGIKNEPDYKAFFVLGLAFFAMGIVNKDLSVFMILGLVYIAMSLANKKKWKEPKPWKKLSKEEKKIKITLFISLGLLVLLGLIIFLVQYFRIN